MKYKVIKCRKSEFENPIVLSEGDHVLVKELSDKNGDWPGWFYCESRNNEGWVPYQMMRLYADLGVMTNDYDATEFDLELGEVIVRDYELNGWIWGHKLGCPDKMGWTPLNHIERL